MTGCRTSPGKLEARLGYRFSDRKLLHQALVHPSVATGENNQRFEFLGDRVLALVIAEHLLGQFPKEREGAISKRHGQLVRRETLAGVARRIGLGDHIRISAGGDDRRIRTTDRTLADALEAVIASIYLDGGLAAARTVILEYWEELVVADRRPPRDPKTDLQEWAQGQGLPLPDYVLLACDGPAHDPEFVVGVRVAGRPQEQAHGRTRRQAEQAAAAAVLKAIRTE